MVLNYKKLMESVTAGVTAAGGLAKDKFLETKSKRNLKKTNKKALDAVMNEYPSMTVVNPETRRTRKKEFKGMIEQGKTRDAFTKAKKLKKEFYANN